MLIFALVAGSILVSCLILHYRLHFRLETCCCTSNELPPDSLRRPHVHSSSDSISKMNEYCKCAIFTSRDDELNFFPKLFVIYLLLLLFLCIIILLKMFIALDHHNYTNFDEFYQMLLDLNHILSYTTYSNLHPNSDIIDWILIYGILTICVFESFFSFYRIGIVKKSEKMKEATFTTLIKKFSFFGIIFITLFIIQIHVYYFLWPLLSLSHLIFNMHCNIKFSSYLIKKYSSVFQVQYAHSKTLAQINYNILSSVYFMRRTIIVSTLLQSLYFTTFIFLYNIDIIYYYLPLFWAIASILFTAHFVRDKQFIKEKLFKLYQCIKLKLCYCKSRSTIHPKNNNLSNHKPNNICTQKTMTNVHGERKTDENISIQHIQPKTRVLQLIETKFDENCSDDDDKYNTMIPTSVSSTGHGNMKAALLLGLTSGTTSSNSFKSKSNLSLKQSSHSNRLTPSFNLKNIQSFTAPFNFTKKKKLNNAKSNPMRKSLKCMQKTIQVSPKHLKYNIKPIEAKDLRIKTQSKRTLKLVKTKSSPVVETNANVNLDIHSNSCSHTKNYMIRVQSNEAETITTNMSHKIKANKLRLKNVLSVPMKNIRRKKTDGKLLDSDALKTKFKEMHVIVSQKAEHISDIIAEEDEEQKEDDDEWEKEFVLLTEPEESEDMMEEDDHDEIGDDSLLEQMMRELNDFSVQEDSKNIVPIKPPKDMMQWTTSINEVVDTMSHLVDLGYCTRKSILDLKHLAMYEQESCKKEMIKQHSMRQQDSYAL